MTIRTNRLMDNYLQKLGYDFWNTSKEITDQMAELLKQPFIEGNDLVIWETGKRTIPEQYIEQAEERSWYEYDENHIHIDNYIKSMDFNSIEFLGYGLECLKRLITKMKKELRPCSLSIMLSFSKVEEINRYEFGNCVLRFYKIRNNQRPESLKFNLDEFKQGGILEIDFDIQ